MSTNTTKEHTMNTTVETLRNKLAAKVAAQTDQQLVATMLVTESTLNKLVRGSDDWRAYHKVQLAVIDELESRYDVDAVMEAWAAEAPEDVSYVEALVAALPVKAVG